MNKELTKKRIEQIKGHIRRAKIVFGENTIAYKNVTASSFKMIKQLEEQLDNELD